MYGGRGEEGASPPDRGLLGPPVYVYLHLKTPKKTLPQVVGEGKGGKEGRREEDRQQRLRWLKGVEKGGGSVRRGKGAEQRRRYREWTRGQKAKGGRKSGNKTARQADREEGRK